MEKKFKVGDRVRISTQKRWYRPEELDGKTGVIVTLKEDLALIRFDYFCYKRLHDADTSTMYQFKYGKGNCWYLSLKDLVLLDSLKERLSKI